MPAVEVKRIRWRGQQQRRQIRLWLVDEYGACFYCSRELSYDNSTIDHVIPLTAGGTDTEDNMVLSCWRCNRRKANADLQFIAAHPNARGWGLMLTREVEALNTAGELNRGIEEV